MISFPFLEDLTNTCRKPKRQKITLMLPVENLREVLSLWERYNECKPGVGKIARFEFWEAIHKIFPETKDQLNYEWNVDQKSSHVVLIVGIPQ